MRPLTTTLAAAGSAAAATGALVLSGGGAGAAVAAPTVPTTPTQKTVTGSLIRVQSGTLGVGSQIPNHQINARRTYFGNSWAVTLGHDRQGAVYPVQTGNGGRKWRTVGPALWVPAADAPNVVSTVTAATRSLQYAYGGGQVVDVTRDGGPQWRRATFDGTVLSVAPGIRKNELVAFVNNGAGTTWQYVTRNGGATWTYFPRFIG